MRGKPYKGGRPRIDLKLLKSFSLSFSLSVLSFSLSLFLCWSSSFLEASARLTKSFKVKGCGSLIGSCCRLHGSIDTEAWPQILRLDLTCLLFRCWILNFIRNVNNLLRLLIFLAGLCDLVIMLITAVHKAWQGVFTLGWAGINWSCSFSCVFCT